MRIITVRNEGGQSFQVDEDKIGDAEKDGYLPVVSNGENEHRVSHAELSNAEKDGFSLIGDTPSPFASGLRHFVQDASVGLSDEVAGGIEAAGRVAGVKGAGGPMKDIGVDDDGPTLDWSTLRDAYRRAREKERNTLKKDEIVNPAASTAGGVAGSIMSPVNKIAPNASFAKQGAMFGGASGFGNSESENVLDLATDTAIGTGLGLTIGKGADKAAPYIQKGTDFVSGHLQKAKESVGAGAKNLAERFSARAQGAERATIKSLGPDKVRKIGRHGLDEGFVTPFASTDDMIAGNAASKARGGELMEDVYSQIDDAGKSTFNPLEAASDIDAKIGDFYRSPINRGETNQLENTLESILMRGEGNIPMKEAQILKKELGKVANWKNKLNISDKEKMARDAYGIVSDHIDRAADVGSQEIGSKGLLETLRRGKLLHGNARGSEVFLENLAAKEGGNKFGFGMTDTIMGAGALGYGGITDDWKGAGGVMIAKKGLEKYGAKTAAVGFNKVAKSLLKSPRMAELAQKSPGAFQAIVFQLEKRINSGGQVAPMAASNEAPQPNRAKETVPVGEAQERFINGN